MDFSTISQSPYPLVAFIISLVILCILVIKKKGQMNDDKTHIELCKNTLQEILNDKTNKDIDVLLGQHNKDIDFDKIYDDLKTRNSKRKNSDFKWINKVIFFPLFFVIILTACQNSNINGSKFTTISITFAFISSLLSLILSIVLLIKKRSFEKNAKLLISEATNKTNEESPDYLIRRAEEYNNIGEIGLSNADYEQALVLLQKNKSDGLKVSRIMHLLANQYRDAKEYDKSESHYKNAISVLNEIDFKINPFAFKELIKVQNDYGNMLVSCGKTDKALGIFANALNLFQNNNTTEDDYLMLNAMTLNNLAIQKKLKNEFYDALNYYNQALSIYRGLTKKDQILYQSYLASTLNNLGNLHRNIGKYIEAEKEYLEALEKYRQLAEITPETYLADVATTLNNLGILHSDTGKYGDAEKELAEALEIRRKLVESSPEAYLPDVALTLNSLGILHSVTGKHVDAEKELTEALEIRRKLAEASPEAYLPDVAKTLGNLGNLHRNTGKHTEAEKEFDEILTIFRQLAEAAPEAYLPYVAMTLNNLGALHYDTGKHGDAEKDFGEALEIYRKLTEFSPEAYLPDVATTLNNLGILHKNTGKHGDAEKEYGEALEIRRKLAESSPEAYLPYVATTLFNMAIFRMEQGNLTEAAQMAQESLEKYQTMAELSHAAFDQYVEKAKNLLEEIRAKQAEEE